MTVKPARWNVDPSLVHPSWRWAWRDLFAAVSFDGNEFPFYDVVAQREVERGLAAGAFTTPTKYGIGLDLSPLTEDDNGPGVVLDATKDAWNDSVGEFTFYWFGFYRSGDNLSSIFQMKPNDYNGRSNGVQVYATNNLRARIVTSVTAYQTDVLSIPSSAWLSLVARWDGSNIEALAFTENGELFGQSSLPTSGTLDTSQDGRLGLGHGATSARQTDAIALAGYVWTRKLTDDEIRLLVSDPFGPIRPVDSFSREPTFEESTGKRMRFP